MTFTPILMRKPHLDLDACLKASVREGKSQATLEDDLSVSSGLSGRISSQQTKAARRSPELTILHLESGCTDHDALGQALQSARGHAPHDSRSTTEGRPRRQTDRSKHS